ncbi:MAG: 4-hydroxythreonine-4-phosphate dehydrogenase PdxA [Ruminococcaceae bacterium]|nr:4-hydroxythreonine-4-phosphate dehydrogenase PdxA [Oscillospiraceae bacterium]
MIAVTLGDGNGVGPEIILKAYQEGTVNGDFFVVGDLSVLLYCSQKLGYNSPLHSISTPANFQPGRLNVIDLNLLTEADIEPGTISAKVAAASRDYVEFATRLCMAGDCDAICTLPVNKEAIRLTDPGFTGHTELIAEICGETDFTMMLASEKLTVTHVSTHCSLQDAIYRCTKDRVLKVIRLTHEALLKMKPQQRIAVAGLNPHAGEGGAFGCQEIDEIAPAIAEAQAEGINVSGPHPTDTVFAKAVKGAFDAVVCMYHDQGHAPVKLLDFHGGVNVTLGLCIIRTSVDHGTAFDIAYQGIADTGSLLEAYDLAVKMVSSQKMSQ